MGLEDWLGHVWWVSGRAGKVASLGDCQVGLWLVASSSLAALAPVWVGEAGPICQS